MDLALDDSGDLLIPAALTDGLEAIRQSLLIRLRLFYGEWFLAPFEGTPYYDQILVKNPDLALVRTILRRQILTDSRVISVTRIDVALDSSRHLTVSFDALVKLPGEGSLVLLSFSDTILSLGGTPLAFS